MNAYELSERKNSVLAEVRYLQREAEGNNTDTVLLTNEEVADVIGNLNFVVEMIDSVLKKTEV